MKILKVSKSHKSEFHVPLIALKGETVQGEKRDTEYEGWFWCQNRNGVAAWVPETYLERTSDAGQFQFRKDYNSRELTIDAGQEVMVLDEESGWAWVRTTLGEEGWLPIGNLRNFSEKPDSIPDLQI